MGACAIGTHAGLSMPAWCPELPKAGTCPPMAQGRCWQRAPRVPAPPASLLPILARLPLTFGYEAINNGGHGAAPPPRRLPTPPARLVPLTSPAGIEGCSSTSQCRGHGAGGALTYWRHGCAPKDALTRHLLPNTPKMFPWGCFPAPGCQWVPHTSGFGALGFPWWGWSVVILLPSATGLPRASALEEGRTRNAHAG